MNLIETLCGNENFVGMQSKVWLFYTPSHAFPSRKGEEPIFTAAKTSLHGMTGQPGNRINAHEHAIDGSGTFTQSRYSVPEGMIFKLFAMRKVPGQMRAASLFLKSRADAALIRLEIELTGYRHATLQRAWVEGRFDVLSLADAKAAGVRVLPMHEKQFNPAVVNTMIVRREMSPQIAAAPVVRAKTIVNTEGETVRVTETRRKRSLDLS
jgi:hypothetical protein